MRPWGERFAGVDISTWVPVVLGVLGGTIMTALFTLLPVLGVLQDQRPDQGALSGGALALFAAAYLPMFFFGPLTLAATAGYAMRRSRETYAAPTIAPRQPTPM